jgi:hypothetical protein
MRPYSCMAVSTRFFVTTQPFRASTRSVISCGGGRQLDLFSNLCRLRTPRARRPPSHQHLCVPSRRDRTIRWARSVRRQALVRCANPGDHFPTNRFEVAASGGEGRQNINMWMTDVEATLFLLERGEVIGRLLEIPKVGDELTLNIGPLIAATVEGNKGVVTFEGSRRDYNIGTDAGCALFMHRVDELIIQSGLAEPAALETVFGLQDKALLPSATFPYRLANHLWRGDRAHHDRLPDTRVGRGTWRSILDMSALHAASIAVGLTKITAPVLSLDDMHRDTGRLQKAVPDNPWTALDGKQFYCFVYDDGFCRMFARMIDGDVVGFWLADADNSDFLEVLDRLESYGAQFLPAE